MKRVMAVVLVAAFLWSAGVTFVTRMYFPSWLWGTPLAILGGAVIGVILGLWLRKRWIKPKVW